MFSGATNATATAVTGKLAGGCYNVAVSKPGYNLFADPNPLCVNGATSLFLVDTDPYIFNITWPSSYPYANDIFAAYGAKGMHGSVLFEMRYVLHSLTVMLSAKDSPGEAYSVVFERLMFNSVLK